MDLRAITGYVAHALLAGYWLWTVASTAPQLRKSNRDRRRRWRILAIQTAGFVLTATVIGVIHYWATQVWHVAVCLVLAAVVATLLRREYRRTVAAPRHRLTLARRARRLDVLPRRRSGVTPAHVRHEPAAASTRLAG